MATSKRQASKYAKEAAFVFVGRVIKPKAATMEGLAANNTAIVQVDRVVYGARNVHVVGWAADHGSL